MLIWRIRAMEEWTPVVAAVGMRATRERCVAEHAGNGVAPYRHRRTVFQRLVRPDALVEGNPMVGAGLGLSPVGVARYTSP
jgi:hypothetical protein